MENYPDQDYHSKPTEDRFQVLSTNETTNTSLSKPNELLSPSHNRNFLKFSSDILKEKLLLLDSTNEISELTKPQLAIPEFSHPFASSTSSMHENLGPNTLLSWLSKLELEPLYEVLIQNGYDDLNFLIEQMKIEPLNEEILEKIGVTKIGHRKVLLAFLEQETDKYFRRSFPIKSSCCTENSQENIPSLYQWLDSLYLKDLFDLFVESGFANLNQMLFIMNSSYPITDETLKSINILKIGHRQRILFKLKEDAGQFNKKSFCINYDIPSSLIACSKCLIV
jgi:hypothetical protein